jgi:hypothetical protein
MTISRPVSMAGSFRTGILPPPLAVKTFDSLRKRQQTQHRVALIANVPLRREIENVTPEDM